ncbi:MAG: hypothetical protein KJO98_02415 [Rhodothermia bacterium]|nr:hypothetical protein [Rhodothermia bacterium]
MRAYFVGVSDWTDLRMECAGNLGWDVRRVDTDSDLDLSAAETDARVVFVAGAASELLPTAEMAVRSLAHAYLDTDSVSPLAEARLLIARAREARVQLSCTRPLLFDEQIRELLEEGPARMLSVTSGLNSIRGWRRSLQAAADLAGTLCGTFATRRIDVEVARDGTGLPVMALLSLRFLNGAFAHVRIGPDDSLGEASRIFAATEVGIRSIECEPRVRLVTRETDAFLSALQNGSSVPVDVRSVLDASALVEEILRRLRQ